VSHIFRNAVLALSGDHAFARPLVNSGRLSVPCTYDGMPLNGADELAGGPERTRPGSPCPDAPLGNGFLLGRLGGGFTLLCIDVESQEAVEDDGVVARRVSVSAAEDTSGALAARYLGETAIAVYLIRPDQHVAARWGAFDAAAVRVALRRACGKG